MIYRDVVPARSDSYIMDLMFAPDNVKCPSDIVEASTKAGQIGSGLLTLVRVGKKSGDAFGRQGLRSMDYGKYWKGMSI